MIEKGPVRVEEASARAPDRCAGAVPVVNDALLAGFLDEVPVGLGLLGPDMRWAYVNHAFLRITGLRPEQILGLSLAATRFAGDADAVGRILTGGLSTEASVVGLTSVSEIAATGWHIHYRRVESGGSSGVIASVVAGGREDRRELAQARRRLALQDAATERIGTTLDLDTTCWELADFTVPAMSDFTTVEVAPYGIPDRDRAGLPLLSRMRRAALACTPELRLRLGSLGLLNGAERPGADSVTARSLMEGKPVVANRIPDAELERRSGGGMTSAAYRLARVGSILAVPLNARGRLLGTMTLARAGGPGRDFTDDDVVLARDLADRAAVSVANAQQYTDAQTIALELQRALLVEPGRPHSNLEVAARYLPSGSRSLVGGDWYEIVRLPYGRTLLVLGDVMGHGVEAAVDMSNYRSTIRDVGSMDLPPRGILEHLDGMIAAHPSARPATCLLAVADPNRGRWTIASAGHPLPALFAPGRPAEFVPLPVGPPLGTGVGGYEQVTVGLLPDQVMLLYTDGLVERRGEDIDTSLARLAAVALPSGGMLTDLLDAVLQGLASPAADDDIALLAARAVRR